MESNLILHSTDDVAKWTGETIIANSKELQAYGFSKEYLSELLYLKIEFIDNYVVDQQNFLELISANKAHLYELLDAYFRDTRYMHDSANMMLDDICYLKEHGANVNVLERWLADNLSYFLFWDGNVAKSLDDHNIAIDDMKILESILKIPLAFATLLNEKASRGRLLDFIENSNVDVTIQKINSVTNELVDFYFDNIDNNHYIEKYPKIWQYFRMYT